MPIRKAIPPMMALSCSEAVRSLDHSANMRESDVGMMQIAPVVKAQ